MAIKKSRQYFQRQSLRPNFALSVLAAAMLPITAGAAGNYDGRYSYADDPGFIAANPGQMAAAKKSWETAEYGFYTGHNPANAGIAVDSAWQLAAVKASTAYALGYFGQNVTLGMMDSGYRSSHQGFQSDRILSVNATGVFGTSGYGYRGATPGNPFVAGEGFNVRADFVVGDPAKYADWSHGTSMLGVSSGIRDGKEQHGIAFGSTMYSAFTGGSDSQSHGAFHDYVYWYTANKALVDAGAQVINSSWGSYVQTLNRTRYDGLGNDLGVDGNLANAYEVGVRDSASATAAATWMPSETLGDLEYQYFFSRKTYSEGGIQYNAAHSGRSFMDAIWDVIKDTTVVNVRSAGNNDWANPYYRPAYPLFNPWAENQWVAVGGVMPPPDNNSEYVKQSIYNEAGLAKWWTVSTPSNLVRTTNSGADDRYGNSSGTSPATPVATAVMGVLLSRYPNMNAMQVRELMFTTASNKQSDGQPLATGQLSASGESTAWTAPDGLPDERWGWGIPDLDKGMYGPGQFLSPMVYNMDKAALDVWTNDISEVAIRAREQEDLAWLADYRAQGVALAGDYSPNVLNEDGSLKDNAFMTQGLLNDPLIQAKTGGHPEMYDKITYEQAQQWRKEWMDEKQRYIEYKIANNLYNASLTKQGAGRLVLTGDNTYAGGTTVEAGELYGFTESFGTGDVAVNGGRFGILSGYNDLFTMKGQLNSTGGRKANIQVNNGGTYVIMADNDVSVGTLAFGDGSQITVGHIDRDLVKDALDKVGAVATGKVTADTLTGFEKAAVVPNLAFLDLSVTAAGNTLSGSLKPNTLSYADYGLFEKNAGAIGAVLDAAHQVDLANGDPGAFYDALDYYTVDPATLRASLDSLGSDFYLNADNASAVNAVSVTRSVKDQALGLGRGQSAKVGDSARLWVTVSGNWATLDYGYSDMDADSQTALIGAEADVNANNTVGVFFGAGSSEMKGGQYGKVESDDVHGGVYGIYRGSAATLSYGLTYSQQNRDARRTLIVGGVAESNKVKPDARITQVFAEAAYTGLNTQTYTVEPYVGLNLMNIKTDGYSEQVGNMLFRTTGNSQSLQAGTLGVRGSVKVGNNVALKGDLSALHFFGNDTPEAKMFLANTGVAKIEGGKLGTLVGVGLGLEATLSSSAKLSVSYNGAFNSDIKSNGVFANLRIGF